MVRPDDIAANNTLFSYNIADATIQFISKGTITDNQQQRLVHARSGTSSVRSKQFNMRRTLEICWFWLFCWLPPPPPLPAARGSRTSPVIAGARDNQLVGYGLVVGLAGDGDKNPIQTVQTIANMLQRYGMTVPASTLSAKNVAVVMVTADIPGLQKGRARNWTSRSLRWVTPRVLQGGVLIQTPLLGADGKVYAVAQGALVIGGISAGTDGGGGATVQKNHPTVGQIIDGALVEREIPAQIVSDHMSGTVVARAGFHLRRPDGRGHQREIPQQFPGAGFHHRACSRAGGIRRLARGFYLADLKPWKWIADVPARIIINERTGTIVATSRIRIASCAVSHGNLTISIASTLDVSQPSPFSQSGQTAVTPRTDTKVKEDKGRGNGRRLPEMPTVEKVAAALNSLGVYAARHDVHVPGHETGRRVAGGTDHPLIWTFPRSRTM